MYSLVTPSVLVTDLAVLPQGRPLLGFMRRLLTLPEESVEVLAAHLGGADERAQAWRHVRGAPTPTQVGEVLGLEVAPAIRVAAVPSGLAEKLAGAQFGDLDGLVEFTAREGAPWSETRADEAGQRAGWALQDAAAALYTRPHVPAAHVRVLYSPWQEWLLDAVTGVEETSAAIVGPAWVQVDAVRIRLRETRRLPEALCELPNLLTRSWPQAMHAATWAAYTTRRLRGVTVAHAAAAQTLAGLGLPAATVRGAAAPMLARVTAEVLRDVLDDDTYLTLSAPWLSAE